MIPGKTPFLLSRKVLQLWSWTIATTSPTWSRRTRRSSRESQMTGSSAPSSSKWCAVTTSPGRISSRLPRQTSTARFKAYALEDERVTEVVEPEEQAQTHRDSWRTSESTRRSTPGSAWRGFTAFKHREPTAEEVQAGRAKVKPATKCDQKRAFQALVKSTKNGIILVEDHRDELGVLVGQEVAKHVSHAFTAYKPRKE